MIVTSNASISPAWDTFDEVAVESANANSVVHSTEDLMDGFEAAPGDLPELTKPGPQLQNPNEPQNFLVGLVVVLEGVLNAVIAVAAGVVANQVTDMIKNRPSSSPPSPPPPPPPSHPQQGIVITTLPK
jgi:hypothetical protein